MTDTRKRKNNPNPNPNPKSKKMSKKTYRITYNIYSASTINTNNYKQNIRQSRVKGNNNGRDQKFEPKFGLMGQELTSILKANDKNIIVDIKNPPLDARQLSLGKYNLNIFDVIRAYREQISE